MKKSKNIIAVVLVAVIGTIIFWKRDWIKEKIGISTKSDSTKKTEQSSSTSSSLFIPGITYTECPKFPFKLGCAGDNIKPIQKALNRKYDACIKEDGKFGFQTQKALKDAGFGKEVEYYEIAKILL